MKMPDDKPVACSLDAGELQQRLAAIAEVGTDSLISREIVSDCHLLRFRPDAATRQRLEDIVAAEARCCSFLDLSLSESEGELILTIAAPEDGLEVADGLAEAFAA
jgi:hypothetical protein